MLIGYARVSTDGQTLDAQREALLAAGCERVIEETASGAKSEREGLARAVNGLNEGDVLIVVRLDRLARSTLDLLLTMRTVATKKASVRSLKEGWADTTTDVGRLMITVLGGIAEFERSLIMARTSEGRRRAKERGQHMGRPERLTAHQVREVKDRLSNGESARELARSYGVSPTTIGGVRDGRLLGRR